jgi:hypothetical protein
MTRTSSPNEQANLTFEQRLIEYRRSGFTQAETVLRAIRGDYA